MKKNNILHMGMAKNSLKRKVLNAETKGLHIIQATLDHMEKIKYKEIGELLKTIPEIHHSVIEQAVHDRSYKLLGVTIFMALNQLAQENIKKALYP